jgi:F-type H+-transporting ATPase subunit a
MEKHLPLPAIFKKTEAAIMRKTIVKRTFSAAILSGLFLVAPVVSKAAEQTEEKYDPVPVIMEHIKDSHDWHLWGEGEDAVSIPLPVILLDGGVQFFMSSDFHHGHEVVEKGGNYYALVNGKVYKTDAHGTIEFEMDMGGKKVKDKTTVHHLATDHHAHQLLSKATILNAEPLDFSITKNVLAMMVSAFLIFFMFRALAKSYRKSDKAPKGLAGMLEPLVVFVRDDIAKQNIGHKYERFMPYLLTVFFFIWLNNLLGLVPIIPGGANVTGNIALTLTLAVITLVITNVSANKDYWKHIFWMPGVPVPVRIMLAPIELVGILTKPFALMVRLFANITAGHIVVLSLISLIFIFENVAMAGVSVPFALFISVLELLVAALQAYVFTMLSALFIGQAVAEHAHHDDHHH